MGAGVTALERMAYAHIRSFRREEGGLHTVYVAIYSRVYRARMTWLHKRGRHSQPDLISISPRCTWCGKRLP